MKTVDAIRRLLKENEDKLSPYAARSHTSLGRRFPLESDPFRLEFARDENRILHSPPFRRLKHKTQVFLSPNNDHICTRMEHVLHVSSIAAVIGRCLNLNLDLINAIAKGHDLGHPPFGHAGERVLDRIIKSEGVASGFMHEVHGLRVVDQLTNYGAGLNLTYEVRDGIIAHCGEKFERVIAPDRGRDMHKLEEVVDRSIYPATLEGCLVRMVDKIAYLGRDLEDGIKAGLIKKSDIPAALAQQLGSDNGTIIGCFVNDCIANSIDKDAIELSGGVSELMQQLKEFNYNAIYRHHEVERKALKSDHVVESLYHEFRKLLTQSQRGANEHYQQQVVREAPASETFFHFIKNSNYTESTADWRMVTDYVAGMTDLFAERTYTQFFLPTPVI